VTGRRASALILFAAGCFHGTPARAQGLNPGGDQLSTARTLDDLVRQLVDNCRALARQNRRSQAETSCRNALTVVDRLSLLSGVPDIQQYTRNLRESINQILKDIDRAESAPPQQWLPTSSSGSVFGGGAAGGAYILLSEPLIRVAPLTPEILPPGTIALTVEWSGISNHRTSPSPDLDSLFGSSSGMTNLVPTIGVGIGLARRFELDFSWDGYAIVPYPVGGLGDTTTIRHSVGVEDGAAGLKVALRPQRGILPQVSIAGGMNLPLGNGGVVAAQVAPYFAVVAGHSLTPRLSLGYNVGYSRGITWQEPQRVAPLAVSYFTYGLAGNFLLRSFEARTLSLFTEYRESRPRALRVPGYDGDPDVIVPLPVRRGVDAGLSLYQSRSRPAIGVSALVGKGLAGGVPRWWTAIAVSISRKVW